MRFFFLFALHIFAIGPELRKNDLPKLSTSALQLNTRKIVQKIRKKNTFCFEGKKTHF